MSFQIYSTERTKAQLFGGATSYKIEVKFEHGVATQRHTYYGENGARISNNRWIPSLLKMSEVEKIGSGFFETLR